MQTDFEKKYHDLEGKHFWFKGRRDYVLQLLDSHNRDATILDIGCSSGLVLQELIEKGFKADNVYGIDISEKAIANCREKGLKNVHVMDAQEISLDQKFDVIIASDCLEHLQEDEKALDNWYSLLKPNGVAYIFVPAYMFLWSKHDEANMHYRRYTLSELRTKISKRGFQIKKASYWNFLLFFPIAAVRLASRLISSNDTHTGNLSDMPPFNGVLLAMLEAENTLLRWINLPVGVSTFCIAEKKG